VAGPFYPTYMLRDLKMPFVGIGIVNAFFMVAFLVSGPSGAGLWTAGAAARC